VLGLTTQTTLYDNLSEEQISTGLLPRCIIISYEGKEPVFNKNTTTVKLQNETVEKLRRLCVQALAAMQAGVPITVKYAEGAEAYADAYRDELTKIKAAMPTSVKDALWSRAWLHVVKLASLVACGVHPYEPTITIEGLKWARGIVDHSIYGVINKFNGGEVGGATSSGDKQVKVTAAKLAMYFELSEDSLHNHRANKAMRDSGIVPRSALLIMCSRIKSFTDDRDRSAVANLDRALRHLAEIGIVSELSPSGVVAAMVNNPALSLGYAKYIVVNDIAALKAV
jgi:hypothetical protein